MFNAKQGMEQNYYHRVYRFILIAYWFIELGIFKVTSDFNVS